MFNKPNIILDKGKVKSKDFMYFTIEDVFIMLFIGGLGYFVGGIFGELYRLILGLGFGGIAGALRFEMPNSLSIYDYLKLGYEYYFKNPKIYAYYPVASVDNKEEMDIEEETKTEIKHKQTKKKRIGKVKPKESTFSN